MPVSVADVKCDSFCKAADIDKAAPYFAVAAFPLRNQNRDANARTHAFTPASPSSHQMEKLKKFDSFQHNQLSGSVANEIEVSVFERAGPRFESHSGRSSVPQD
uniref:Uncharacterized protein n=1 Tax=Anopheles culicifacies TaxID=139723 RepID=A0A182MG60_9DIPT